MRTISEKEFKKLYGEEKYNSINREQEVTRFGDVGEDIVTGVKQVASDLNTRGQRLYEGGKATFRGEQTLPELVYQAGGEVAGGAFGILGTGVQTAGKLFTSETEEQAIGEAVSGAVGAVDEAVGFSDFYDSLSDRSQRNVSATLGFLELLTTKGVLSVVNKQAKNALRASDDVLKASRDSVPPLRASAGAISSKLRGITTDVRYNLSDLDPNVETALKKSNPDEVNRYFQQARNHKTDASKDTPLELAGAKAEQAFDVVSEATSKAGEGKRAILNQVGDTRISGNTINEVMSESLTRSNDIFGVKIAPDGTVSNVTGRFSKLDTADQKLMTEYYSRLNGLGVAPTLRQVDDFVDWAQSQLYKQSKSLSKLDTADGAVIGELKRTTGELNSRLKDQVGGGYAEVNARMAKLLDMQDELSRALGADARKGGGLMKRIFSPTSGNTRPMFEQIKAETGIDLVKEATLAKFAMESVGDVKQRNLLQSLDLAVQGSQEFDLARPASWYNSIRERADLDGQPLANEYMRRNQ